MGMIDMLSTDGGAFAFHLLAFLVFWTATIITVLQWQYSTDPNHRRMGWTCIALLTLRGFLLLLYALNLPIMAPVANSLEAASLVLLGWIFISIQLDERIAKWYIWIGLGLLPLLVAIFIPSWWGEMARMPEQDYVTFWQQSFWYAWNVVWALLPAILLIWLQRAEKPWAIISGFGFLSAGFVLLYLGALFGTAGWIGPALCAALMSWGRLVALVGYAIFAILIYQTAAREMRDDRQELQAASGAALQQTRDLLFLVEASRTTGDSLNLNAILDRVVESIAMALDADRVAIFLIEPGNAQRINLAAQYVTLEKEEAELAPLTFPLDEQPALSYVLQRHKPLVLNVETENPRLQALYAALGSDNAGPTIVQPLIRQHHAFGALVIGNDLSQKIFEPEKGQMCRDIALQIAAAIENAQRYTTLQNKARHLSELLLEQEEETRYKTALLENLPQGIIVNDRSGHVAFINAAAERVLGASRQRIQGRSLQHLMGDISLGSQAGWESVANTNERLETIFEMRGKFIRVVAAPIVTPAGDLHGTVAVLQDITQRAQSDRSKSDIITQISHEMRTPLTTIRTYTESLITGIGGALSETQSRFIQTIRDGALRLARLAENLVAISQIEKHVLNLTYQDTDLPLLIGDVVSAFQSDIEAHRLVIDVNLPDDLPLIEADHERVRQVLGNLVSNAIKFTYPGGKITIGVQMLEEMDEDLPRTYCALKIADTGIGIPLKEQMHIWEHLHRPSSGITEVGGLGVGLSIVKSLVEAHNGRIWLESTPGVGSTFTVLLPAKRLQIEDGQDNLN